jgi:hypothetical protein
MDALNRLGEKDPPMDARRSVDGPSFPVGPKTESWRDRIIYHPCYPRHPWSNWNCYGPCSVNRHLLAELAKSGVHFDRVYVAPEAPDQPSRGRKPAPQFLCDARDESGLDFAQCYMIGDKLTDLACGWNAGVRHCLLVRTGYGAEQEQKYRDRLGAANLVFSVQAAARTLTSVSSRPASRSCSCSKS